HQHALVSAALRAVPARGVQAERDAASSVPLEEAAALARKGRDRRALLEAARLSASIHERTGEHAASLHELRGIAYQARWLAADLATPVAAQGELVRAELAANGPALRRAPDLGGTAAGEESA